MSKEFIKIMVVLEMFLYWFYFYDRMSNDKEMDLMKNQLELIYDSPEEKAAIEEKLEQIKNDLDIIVLAAEGDEPAPIKVKHGGLDEEYFPKGSLTLEIDSCKPIIEAKSVYTHFDSRTPQIMLGFGDSQFGDIGVLILYKSNNSCSTKKESEN